MQESGLTEIIPLTCPSSIWARILCFPILSLLRVPGNPVGSGGLLTTKWQTFFLHPEFPLGLPLGQCYVMLWQHPLFTDVVGNIFHSQHPPLGMDCLLCDSQTSLIRAEALQDSSFPSCFYLVLLGTLWWLTCAMMLLESGYGIGSGLLGAGGGGANL